MLATHLAGVGRQVCQWLDNTTVAMYGAFRLSAPDLAHETPTSSPVVLARASLCSVLAQGYAYGSPQCGVLVKSFPISA